MFRHKARIIRSVQASRSASAVSRVSLASLNAWRDQALKVRYASLLNPVITKPGKDDQIQFKYTGSDRSNETLDDLKQKFEKSLENAYGKQKSERLLRIFTEHRHGPRDQRPVHYPRTSQEPGEPFKWFRDSEDKQARWSLGDTWDGHNSFALPYRPVNP